MSDAHEERQYLIPRPPPTKTIADFIVIVFVIMVATILVAITATALILTIFTDKDTKAFLAIITDLMTTIISALVGYLAGRSVAKTEEVK